MAIIFQLYFRLRHQEGSGKPDWLELKARKIHLLFYADDINILGGRIQNKEKNTEALVFSIDDVGL